MSTDSNEAHEPVPAKKKRFQFGLTTLIAVVVVSAGIAALLRPKPQSIFISNHHVTFPADQEQIRKDSVASVRRQVETKSIVGKQSLEISELSFASQILIRSDQIQYYFTLEQPYEGGKFYRVIVNPWTGLVTDAEESVYSY